MSPSPHRPTLVLLILSARHPHVRLGWDCLSDLRPQWQGRGRRTVLGWPPALDLPRVLPYSSRQHEGLTPGSAGGAPPPHRGRPDLTGSGVWSPNANTGWVRTTQPRWHLGEHAGIMVTTLLAPAWSPKHREVSPGRPQALRGARGTPSTAAHSHTSPRPSLT